MAPSVDDDNDDDCCRAWSTLVAAGCCTLITIICLSGLLLNSIRSSRLESSTGGSRCIACACLTACRRSSAPAMELSAGDDAATGRGSDAPELMANESSLLFELFMLITCGANDKLRLAFERLIMAVIAVGASDDDESANKLGHE